MNYDGARCHDLKKDRLFYQLTEVVIIEFQNNIKPNLVNHKFYYQTRMHYNYKLALVLVEALKIFNSINAE